MTFDLNVFSSSIFAPILIMLGTFGNIFGTIISTKKNLINLGPQSIYICMFIFDCVNFSLIIQPYLLDEFNIDLQTISNVACKSYWYVNYAFATISPMMNIYISIDRFISITYPTYKFFLRKKNIQIVFMMVVIVFNMVIYPPAGMFHGVQMINETNSSYVVCDFIDFYWLTVVGYLDLANRVIIPCFLMVLFSVLIIRTIFASRLRLTRSTKTNNMFKKDVHFAVMSIGLNMVYLVLSLPISILVLFPDYMQNEFYVFFTYVYFGAYCSNFYCMLLSNRLFRNELVYLFKGKPRSNRKINNNTEMTKRKTYVVKNTTTAIN